MGQSDFDFANKFFDDDGKFDINLTFFPEYIIFNAMEYLKKEDSSGVVKFLTKLNDDKHSYLRKNKEIIEQLKKVIPILEGVDNWQNEIYSEIRKNFNISIKDYPTIDD